MAGLSELDRRAHELLVRALDLPPHERASFVSATCSGEPRLERYVLELLRAAGRADSFLAAPALERPPAEKPDAVGTYLILGVLGRGGMATVYEAEQREPRRRVALKVLHRGMYGRESLLRFRLEAEALAKLRHPAIAQIYEAGATTLGDGAPAPFFAMELVPTARTLTSYAREAGLSLEECIRLMLEVCDGVHHGHQNGIIHRDLKPGNVLVGPDGRPKVIDFGVAKSLAGGADSPTELAGEPAIVGTLNYMSPEQCAGSRDVDIRTDVYSLGVMLYELVTGRLPHDLAGLPIPAALRRIMEEPAASPRLPKSAFHRDLAAIIAKAIDRQPERRYDGASALAADLRRLLACEAIHARPPGLARGVRLFARRHRAMVSAISAIAFSLLLVAGISTGFALRLSDEVRARARAEAVVSAERDSALWAAYVANIAGAMSALNSGEYVQASARLAASDLHRGTWEHGFLSRMARQSVSILRAPGGMILDLAAHPSETLFVTCDDRGGVSLWSPSGASPISTVSVSENARATAACFDSSGSRVLVGTSDGFVHVLNGLDLVPVGEPIVVAAPVRDLAALPDGRIAIAHGAAEPAWWGGPAPPWPSPQPLGVESLAVSPDGRWFATADGAGEILIRDGGTHQPVAAVRFPGSVNQMRFDPSGARLAAVGGSSSVLVWSVPDGEVVYELEPTTRATTVRSLDFSSDGRMLAVGLIHRGIVMFDLRTGERLGDYNGHSDAVTATLFRDGDRVLLSASLDGSIRTWRLSELGRPGGVSSLRGHSDYVYAARFAPDGKAIASGSRDRTVRLWDPDRAAEIATEIDAGTFVLSVDFTPDGSSVALSGADGSVRLLDRPSGEMRTFEPGFTVSVWAVAIDPMGRRIAAGAEDGSIRVWDVESGALTLEWKAHDARVYTIVFSPDGTRIATASRDKTAGLWDAATGQRQPLGGGHESDVFAVAFSHDGSMLYSGSRDQTIGVWDVGTGDRLRSIAVHGHFVTCLALSPDGSRLAAGSWFGEVVLFDTHTADPLMSRRAHDAAIRDIDFSPDGRWIATASYDGTVGLADSWSRERADAARSESDRPARGTGRLP